MISRGKQMVFGLVAAAGIVLATGGAAAADQITDNGDNSDVLQTTADGYGDAEVVWTDSSGFYLDDSKTTPAYAVAEFTDFKTGYTMNGWLERSTDGGKTWSRISGIHALTTSFEIGWGASTDAYYDGPGYLARACFQFTSWSGAATHCSDGI